MPKAKRRTRTTQRTAKAKRTPALKATRIAKAKRTPKRKPRAAAPAHPAPRARTAATGKRRPAPSMPSALLDASEAADVLTVPARTALSIDGEGGPHGEAFGRAVGALYGVAYTLKFARKPSGSDFRIGPLEGRWWAEGAADRAAVPPIDRWRWRLRIWVPDDVDEDELADVLQAATMKRGGKLEGSAEARRVAVERVPAQTMGRVLHVGPYADEPRSFAKIEAALAAAGRRAGLPHLEIYLSDPRRTAPSRLRTALLLETA